jgi:hypothetical protein
VKHIFFALSLITGTAVAETFYVCQSGSMEDGTSCTHNTLQAAINAAPPGSTIIVRSGDKFTENIQIPGGRHDLIIKSSRIDSYPRGHRIKRNDPALARIAGKVTMGEEFIWGTPVVGGNTVTFPSTHKFQVGDVVGVDGRMFSPYYCESDNAPPFGSQCAGRTGFFNIRGNSFLANGHKVYFHGTLLPSPLETEKPYYIINYSFGGSSSNPDRFQLALTPDGEPLAIANYIPQGEGFVMEVPASPLRRGELVRVVAVPSPTTIRVARNEGEEPIIWEQISSGYTGSVYALGSAFTKQAAVSNIVFDGLEIAPVSDPGAYSIVYVSRSIPSLEGEHWGLRFLRCWIHGASDQESFPMQGISIAARDSEIAYSIIEDIYSTGNDTQAIAVMSTRNMDIHDNFLSATGESIMSGGNVPWFALKANTENIRLHRNYFWKPLQWWNSIEMTRISGTEFRLRNRLSGAECSTHAAGTNLSFRCMWYEGDDKDRNATSYNRYEWGANGVGSAFTVTGAVSGQKGYLYGLGGTLHLDHNFSGTVTCPAGVECVYKQTLGFPAGSSRVGIAIIGSGNQFDGNFYLEARSPFVKNALESKYGDNWDVEGNVFHRQFLCQSYSYCQDALVQFTLSANGSGDAEMINYSISSSNSIFRNNIFRHAGKGFQGVGKTFSPSGSVMRYEITKFGKSENVRIENNLMVDIGSSEWISGGRAPAIAIQDVQSWYIAHNTAVDIRNAVSGSGRDVNLNSNVFVGYRANCAQCSSPAATSHPGFQNFVSPFAGYDGDSASSWMAALSHGHFNAASQFENNILLNRNGFFYSVNRGTNYPNTTWLVQSNDAQRDPQLLFVNYIERPDNHWDGSYYRNANFRIRPSEVPKYPAADDRVIGADIDEIEALTGSFGKDVEEGLPTFAERSGRSISAGPDSATLSYVALSPSACTLRLWDNKSYTGTPRFEGDDQAAESVDGHRVVSIGGLEPGKTYFGKRWCEADVDVFSFTTLSSGVNIELEAALPAGSTACRLEYGSDPTSITDSVEGVALGGICRVSIPMSATYFRHVFLNAGRTQSRTSLQKRFR